jgi:hypothetical protein
MTCEYNVECTSKAVANALRDVCNACVSFPQDVLR